jgi:putative transposase
MIDRGSDLTVRRQAQLVGLSRSSVYYRPRAVPERDLGLMRRIDELHLEAPFYGARKLAAQLRREGHAVGRRHVATLMRRMGIEALYRKPRTSRPARQAAIYPYLLANVAIERPNQVWASDLTYLPMAHGFMYLVAILDVASRKVLAWRLSNTMTAEFCVAALEEALAKYGRPEIFNTDHVLRLEARFSWHTFLSLTASDSPPDCEQRVSARRPNGLPHARRPAHHHGHRI